MLDIKVLLWLCIVNIHVIKASLPCPKYLCTSEVERLRDYINIRTTRDKDLSQAVDFLKRLGAEQGVEVTVFEAKSNYPIVILKWPGQDPTLKSIVLLSHLDVNSACYEDGWKYPPFSGEITDNCDIIGRGTQAQKSLTLQHYEALSRLKQNNVTLLRTVYIVVTSDQTIGSSYGIRQFIKTKTFENMNVGFVLGVGGPSPQRVIYLYNEFKTKYVIRIDCYGPSSSSARIPRLNSTAVEVCENVFRSYNRYREQQYRLSLRSNNFGDYTVINFVGGRNLIEYDVVPAHLKVYFAAYLAFDTSVEDFIELVRGWVSAAGGNITVSSIYKEKGIYYTKTDDSNPYYVALQNAFDDLNISFEVVSSATTTDTTFLVNAGIPAFGLFPVLDTPLLVNAVNELLPIRSYLEGIKILKVIISRLANIPDEKVGDDPREYLISSKTHK
ncbi:PREDICTED: aminoacylase-1-like [Papilio polytes]|uniref:aminoacylase-1-like n=1 Tax=Papilio polytes TaxID=76194 RepID=UPI0006767A86|nr:PREDICTED: aminoacylase-1-like [Papilio polytes]